MLELLQTYELCQLFGQVFRSLTSSNIANRSSDNSPTAGISSSILKLNPYKSRCNMQQVQTPIALF